MNKIVENIIWIILVIGISIGAAHMFRYTPTNQILVVFDRWEHRVCMADGAINQDKTKTQYSGVEWCSN